MQVPLLVWNIRCTFRLEKLCDILFTTRLHNTIVRQANQGESGGLPATPPRWSGFRLCFIPNPAFRRVAAPRWAMILSPLRAQVSARRWHAKAIYCAEGGFFQNVADISILYKIFGTRVLKSSPFLQVGLPPYHVLASGNDSVRLKQVLEKRLIRR